MEINKLKKPLFLKQSPARDGTADVRAALKIAEQGLKEVILDGGFILASADRLFRHPFGRDSAISAGKLFSYNSDIARKTILLMAALQGVKYDRKTEEEPGKIFHEMKVRGNDSEQQAIFDAISQSLGIGDGKMFVSYTSVDSTMEFIHLTAQYVQAFGDDLLQESVRRHGEEVTIGQAVKDAVIWLRESIARSDVGLVGAYRTNPNAVIVPDLLDGLTSFMHADGKTLINYHKEVNTINFQGLAYRSLLGAADVLPRSLVSDEERAVWRSSAEILKKRTVELFWDAARGCVAMAIDRDSAGVPRRLAVQSILPAAVLWTGIFDGHPDIANTALEALYEPDMMTCVGPRTQSLSLKVGYTRYQEPPWPVLIGRTIDGAVRLGEDVVAVDLIERLCAGASAAGRAEEFHQVTSDNKLGFHVAKGKLTIAATNKPEAPQAWTAATLWELTSITLPLLSGRQARTRAAAWRGKDLLLNKTLSTVEYTLDRSVALEKENAIYASSLRSA